MERTASADTMLRQQSRTYVCLFTAWRCEETPFTAPRQSKTYVCHCSAQCSGVSYAPFSLALKPSRSRLKTTGAPRVTSTPFIRTHGSVAEAQPSKRYGRMVSCRAPAVRSVSASHSPPVGEEAIEPSVCCRPS